MRTARRTYPGAQYHVTARITRQEMIFKKDLYKTLLLEYIERAKKKYSFKIYSLCIMGNHFHMIIRPTGESELSTIMKSILCGFAIRFNRINNYSGHVWHDRFRSKVIETIDYFEKATAYIANNPVRAGLVEHPLQYRFNSITAWKKESWGKQYKRVRILFLSIVEKPSEEISSITTDYLENFDLMKSIKINKELSFQNKKPGRPRKI